jgi:hypothetical protein
MKEAIAIRSKNTTLLIETDSDRLVTPAIPSVDGQLAGAAPDAALAKLEEMGDSISLACRSLYAKVVAGMNEYRPAEFSLEFGIKLAGEAGVPMLTKASAEGSIKVNAKWIAAKAG